MFHVIKELPNHRDFEKLKFFSEVLIKCNLMYRAYTYIYKNWHDLGILTVEGETYFEEEGFIRHFEPVADKHILKKYRKSHRFFDVITDGFTEAFKYFINELGKLLLKGGKK